MTTITVQSASQVKNKAGDSAAGAGAIDIQMLYKKHYQHLVLFVQRYVRNAEDAEDVVQSTFIEAMRCADRFAGLSKPSTWLFGIALNIARNQVRCKTSDHFEDVGDDFIEQIADTNSDPAILIESREIVGKVQALLESIPAKIRTTFESVLEGDTTYEQAAVQLQVPVGTVRSRVARVRATVRAEFA